MLAQEYRKAAQRAAEQGDFRRAAYIHGFLLRDDRKAAGVLQRGGLHHDAAMLYLKKLNDPAAAAQAFEAAGEVDRAIELYRQTGRHEAAGDLLRRIGEEDAALAEYAAAAAVTCRRFASRPPRRRQVVAAESPQSRAGHRAFRNGWARRPEGNAALCALELARFHAERGALGPIMTLLDEADALFEVPGQPYNGFFYNEVTRLASLPSMEPRGRRPARPGAGVDGAQAAAGGRGEASQRRAWSRPSWESPSSGRLPWSATPNSPRPPQLKRARDRAVAPGRESLMTGTQTNGIVTAACQAAVTGELFLGFASGRVLSFRADRNQVVTVVENNEPVAGLAVDPDGKTLVVLCQSGAWRVLSCFRRVPDGSFRRRPDVHFSTSTDFWLTPILPWGMERLVGLGEGRELLIVDASSGMVRQRVTIAGETWRCRRPRSCCRRGRRRAPPKSRLMVLTHDGPRWVVCDMDGMPRKRTPLRWQPARPRLELVALDIDHLAIRSALP